MSLKNRLREEWGKLTADASGLGAAVSGHLGEAITRLTTPVTPAEAGGDIAATRAAVRRAGRRPRGLIEKLTTPLPATDRAGLDPEASRLPKTNDPTAFMDEMEHRLNPEDLRTYRLLNFAVGMVRRHAHQSPGEIETFYARHGIDPDTTPNLELIADRSRGFSPLEWIVLNRIFTKLPRSVSDFITQSGENLSLEAVLRHAYAETGAEDSRADAEYLMDEAVPGMIDEFEAALTQYPGLRGVLEYMFQRAAGSRKVASPENLTTEQKRLKEGLLRGAPGAYKALEQLYQLKSLDPVRLYRLLTDPKNETFRETFGFDMTPMTDAYYVSQAGVDLLDSEAINPVGRDQVPADPIQACGFLGNTPDGGRICQAIGLPTEPFRGAGNDPAACAARMTEYQHALDATDQAQREHMRVFFAAGDAEALLNRPLGKKIRPRVAFNFEAFKAAANDCINQKIARIVPEVHGVNHGTEAASLDDLIKRLASDTNIDPIEGNRTLIADMHNRHYQERATHDPVAWQLLERTFQLPPLMRAETDKKKVVNGIYGRIVADPRYKELARQFDLLMAVLLQKVQPARPAKGAGREEMEEYNRQVVAMQGCRRLWRDRRQGAEKALLASWPIADKSSVQVSTMTNGEHFSLKALIEKYAEELPDLGLVNIEQEIMTDILEPIAVALGADLTGDEHFMPGITENYTGRMDLTMAQTMTRALDTLKDIAPPTPVETGEKKGRVSEKDGESGEKPADATASNARIIEMMRASLDEQTKARESRAAAEAAKKK